MNIDDIKNILQANKDRWLIGTHQGNDGNQGNTLEGLFGIEENNLRLPDFGEIELKTQKSETGSYITLFHKEPQPRASIPKLLRAFGWRHQLAGTRYTKSELSFRSTTYANRFTNRGFTVGLTESRIELRFDPGAVNVNAVDVTESYASIGDWLNDIEKRDPHYSSVMPVFWERKEFDKVCLDKLNNTLMCYCETKKVRNVDYYKIESAHILKGFSHDRLNSLFIDGAIAIDIDARTGHNHGTKLRVRRDSLERLFDLSERIL